MISRLVPAKASIIPFFVVDIAAKVGIGVCQLMGQHDDGQCFNLQAERRHDADHHPIEPDLRNWNKLNLQDVLSYAGEAPDCLRFVEFLQEAVCLRYTLSISLKSARCPDVVHGPGGVGKRSLKKAVP